MTSSAIAVTPFAAGNEQIDVMSVVEIAELASDEILKIYDKDTAEWGIQYKDENEPLTLADKSANQIICEGLKKIAPSIPIISEESELPAYDIRQSYEYFWCVDPLDGTKEFIKRNGQFTVNIALCRGRCPVMGVVTIPVEAKTYFAVEGQGAYKRVSRSQPFERIKAAEFSESDAGLTLIGSRSHNNTLTQQFVSKFDSPNYLTLGSSMKLLLVAEGTAHVYPRLAPTREWDTCAADAIVKEAGGSVEQLDGGAPAEAGKPVEYNKRDLLNPFFVVYGRRLHKA